MNHEKKIAVFSKNLNKRIHKSEFVDKRNLTYQQLQQKAKALMTEANVKYNRKFRDRFNVSTAQLRKNIKKYRRSILGGERTFVRKQNRKAMAIDQIEYQSDLYDSIGNFEGYRVKCNAETHKDLYNTIQKVADDFGEDGFIILHYYYGDRNQVLSRTVKVPDRNISINENELTSFKDFCDRIESIQRGEVFGSDKFRENQYELVVNRFDFVTISIEGNADNDKILFHCQDNSGDKSETCVYKVAQEIGMKNIDKKSTNIDNFINDLKMQGIKANIYANSIGLIKKPRELRKNKKLESFKFGRRNIKAYKLNNKDIRNVLIYTPFEKPAFCDDYGPPKPKYNLVYCENSNHLEVLKSEPKLNNIYMSICKRLFRKENDKFKFLFTPTQIYKTNGSPKKFKSFEYLFFDYETIIDWSTSGVMKEYALSVFRADETTLKMLDVLENKEDSEEKKEEIKKLIEKNCVNWRGYDCTEKFYKYIEKNQHKKFFKLVSFNGANFDNLVLYKRLCQLFPESIREPIFNGNQLLDFKINGRHSMFDIRKHLIGTLKKNCDDFGIKSFCKKDISHQYAQSCYENGKLLDELNGKWGEELEEYNNYDVLSLGLLYYRYQQALSKVECLKKYCKELYKFRTIGSLIFDIFRENLSSKNIKLPLLNLKQYKDMQASKVAGRVELFNGKCKISYRVCSLDVCSLYPYICSIAPLYFPCGEIKTFRKFTKRVENIIRDKIYFAYCDIDQSNLIKKNFPLIYPEKTKIKNDWKTKKVLKNYLISKPIIKLLKKHKCKVKIKNGFYFTHKEKNYKFFNFLHDLKNIKNAQDDLRRKKDPAYNNALREVVKLMSNAISGKVIEGLHCEKIEQVNTQKYLKLKHDKNVERVTAINIIGNKVFCSYKVNEESLLKRQRPIYLGCLIYDYAKAYMYDHCYSHVGKISLIYTDTDAAKMGIDAFNKWDKEYANKTLVPHWKEIEKIDERYKTHKLYENNSKVYGSFEEELNENNKGGIFTNKKCWLVIDGGYDYKNKKLINKFGFKGVSKQDLYLNNLDLDFIEKKTINKRNGTIEEKYFISDYQKAYKYYSNNIDKQFKNCSEELFTNLFDNEYVYVLCQNFKKVIKNSKINTDINEKERFNKLNNSICCTYNLKKLCC